MPLNKHGTVMTQEYVLVQRLGIPHRNNKSTEPKTPLPPTINTTTKITQEGRHNDLTSKSRSLATGRATSTITNKRQPETLPGSSQNIPPHHNESHQWRTNLPGARKPKRDIANLIDTHTNPAAVQCFSTKISQPHNSQPSTTHTHRKKKKSSCCTTKSPCAAQ